MERKILKGVVAELHKDKGTAIVILPGFDMCEVKTNGKTYRVGEEILIIKETKTKKVIRWDRVAVYTSSAAAALLLLYSSAFAGLLDNKGATTAYVKKAEPKQLYAKVTKPINTAPEKPVVKQTSDSEEKHVIEKLSNSEEKPLVKKPSDSEEKPEAAPNLESAEKPDQSKSSCQERRRPGRQLRERETEDNTERPRDSYQPQQPEQPQQPDQQSDNYEPTQQPYKQTIDLIAVNVDIEKQEGKLLPKTAIRLN